MKYLRVYIYMSALTLAAWISMILTVKVIEYVAFLIPQSMWRSIVGVVLYGAWGAMLIVGIKLILRYLSAKLAKRGYPAP